MGSAGQSRRARRLERTHERSEARTGSVESGLLWALIAALALTSVATLGQGLVRNLVTQSAGKPEAQTSGRPQVSSSAFAGATKLVKTALRFADAPTMQSYPHLLAEGDWPARWREPLRDPNGQTIRFGLELEEGNALAPPGTRGVAELYRPYDAKAKDWKQLSAEEALAEINDYPTAGRRTKLGKSLGLRKRLETDEGYEIVGHPVNTLWALALQRQALAKITGAVAFHYHATARFNPSLGMGRTVGAWQADQYAALQRLAHPSSVRDPNWKVLVPQIGWSRQTRTQPILAEGTRLKRSPTAVSARSVWDYGDATTIGIEGRAVRWDTEAELNYVDNIARLLADDDGSVRLRFGRYQAGYRLDDVAEVPRLEDHHVERAREIARAPYDWTLTEQRLAGLALVEFEAWPIFRHLGDDIVSRREKFINELSQVPTSYWYDRKPAIIEAAHRWAADLQLHEWM